jgi:hypothetical protein
MTARPPPNAASGTAARATAALIWVFGEPMLHHLVEQYTRSNAALAELFSRWMWAEHGEYLLDAAGRTGAQLRADPALQRLDRTVRGELRGLPVVMIELATPGAA